eukprot:TRINITY_DN12422_c0_g1_i1.p1 TRINITY_DN12422_c0_g1~~TRINITY_DN12422_c0_g1_i1.p1  ORF type:complete len:191 (-),score=32.97 TRINITY_DN12422_c0_g1_i1:161-733(-)
MSTAVEESGTVEQRFAAQYADYLHFPELVSSQERAVRDSAEHMLTQLDELTAIVESVRLNVDTAQERLPELRHQTLRLNSDTFGLIDGLESLVASLDSSLCAFEQRVTAAEQSLSLSHKTLLVLNSLALPSALHSVVSNLQQQSSPQPQAADSDAGTSAASGSVPPVPDVKKMFDELKVVHESRTENQDA